MNTSKAAVVVNSILGKIASIFGYTVGAMSLILIVVGVSDINSYGAVPTIIMLLFVFILCVLSVIRGNQIKKRIRRFKKYVSLISLAHMTSLENIANSTSQSIDFVRKDIQKMIDKKFFVNATLDMRTNQIIIGGLKRTQQVSSHVVMQQNRPIENVTINCPSCGAMNVKQKGVPSNCEYCGSAI